MFTVDDYGRIRRAHRDGMRIREIARQFHHSRYKVREVLRGGGEPPQYVRWETQSLPKLGSVLDRIPEILKTGQSAPPRPGHTAMRFFQRLRDQCGNTGGYDNAFAESCFGTIKNELRMTDYENSQEARRELAEFIRYDNFERKHSSVEYLTPHKFKAQLSSETSAGRLSLEPAAPQTHPVVPGCPIIQRRFSMTGAVTRW